MLQLFRRHWPAIAADWIDLTPLVWFKAAARVEFRKIRAKLNYNFVAAGTLCEPIFPVSGVSLVDDLIFQTSLHKYLYNNVGTSLCKSLFALVRKSDRHVHLLDQYLVFLSGGRGAPDSYNGDYRNPAGSSQNPHAGMKREIGRAAVDPGVSRPDGRRKYSADPATHPGRKPGAATGCPRK
jgi:hypothetical protein